MGLLVGSPEMREKMPFVWKSIFPSQEEEWRVKSISWLPPLFTTIIRPIVHKTKIFLEYISAKTTSEILGVKSNIFQKKT